MLEIIFTVFFVLWGLISILGQFKSDFITKFRNYDLLSLIPQWNFFAPHAAEYDYYLLYRDTDQHEGLSNWHEVKTLKERSWWTFLWNPHKRKNKAVFDVGSELMAHLTPKKDEYIEYSVAYLAFLLLVSDEPRLLKKGKTQFMLMQRKVNLMDTETQVLYISKLHDIE